MVLRSYADKMDIVASCWDVPLFSWLRQILVTLFYSLLLYENVLIKNKVKMVSFDFDYVTRAHTKKKKKLKE